MTPIHKTLTDDDGEIYEVVSRNWVWIITGLIALQTVGLCVLLVLVLTGRARLNDVEAKNEVQRQRNLATDEMLVNRARVQQWTFDKVCEAEKAHGHNCYDNPRWWADRSKYPALANDPESRGSGLFPREEE